MPTSDEDFVLWIPRGTTRLHHGVAFVRSALCFFPTKVIQVGDSWCHPTLSWDQTLHPPPPRKCYGFPAVDKTHPLSLWRIGLEQAHQRVDILWSTEECLLQCQKVRQVGISNEKRTRVFGIFLGFVICLVALVMIGDVFSCFGDLFVMFDDFGGRHKWGGPNLWT